MKRLLLLLTLIGVSTACTGNPTSPTGPGTWEEAYVACMERMGWPIIDEQCLQEADHLYPRPPGHYTGPDVQMPSRVR